MTPQSDEFCTKNALYLQDVDGEKCSLTKGDEMVVATVAKLLQLNMEDVRHVTLSRQINVRGNITEIPLKVQEV